MSGGTIGEDGFVLVKGSHIYKQQGTYDITVYITGPDGQTVSDDTATATVVPMPDTASQPITVPMAYSGAEALAYESLSLQGEGSISSYVGVGFSLNPVAQIVGTYSSQADDTVSDYRAQINWGDGNTWDTTASLVSGGTIGEDGFVLVKGSHIYKQQGTYDITVYITGPDGQTVSDDTATATVVPMPDTASQPITVPMAYSGAEALAYESLSLQGEGSISSYVGVGFSLNPVAQIVGTYSGQADDTVSDYKAQINWGDGNTWDTTASLVPGGTIGEDGFVLVKGSHIYKQQGTYDITVYVTGPDGQTISDDTATATVVPMPDAASQPITVPKAYSGAKALAYESLSLQGEGSISSYVGAGFSLSPVAQIVGTYSGQADGTVSDYKAQINWGDGNTWDTTASLVSGGIIGEDGFVLVEGSHTYNQQGTYDITVYITGPDGQTISDNTASAIVSENPNAINLGSLSPAEWQQNEQGYDGTISVVGGTGGYNSLQVSGLPPGLSASVLTGALNGQQSGTIDISGTPTQSGAFTLMTTIQDGNGDKGSGTETLTITVPPITLGNLSPAQWQVNQPGYSGTISVTGGSDGYQDLQVGGLPPGLTATVLSSTINGQQSGTITISGTPTQYGTFSLATTLQDGNGDLGSGTENLTIGAPPITLGDLSPAQWQENQPGYDGTISVTGGSDGYQDLHVAGLPRGLIASVVTGPLNGQQSGTIEISGTPTQSGAFTLTTTLQDGEGNSGGGMESLTITVVSLVLGTLTPSQWTVSQPGYQGTIAVSGGNGDYQNLEVTGLPPGLSAQLSGNSIAITGTPTQSGAYRAIDVTVQDSAGDKGNGTYSLIVSPAIELGALNPTQWQLDEPGYDGTIPVQGGSGGYSNLNVSGLPTGLTASMESSTLSVNGTPMLGGTIFINGTPTESGIFTIGVSLQDATGALDPKFELTITASPPPPKLEVTLQQIEQIIPAPPAPPDSPPAPPEAIKGKVTARAKKAYAKQLAAYRTAVSNSAAYPTLAAGLVNFLNSSQAIVTDQINTRKRQAAFIGQVAVESGYLTTLTQGALFGTVNGTTPGYGYLQITGADNDNAAATYLDKTLSQTISLMATDPGVAASVSGWYWNGGTGVPGINKYADAWDITSVSKLVNKGALYKVTKNKKGKVIKKTPTSPNNLQQRIDYSNAALEVLE